MKNILFLSALMLFISLRLFAIQPINETRNSNEEQSNQANTPEMLYQPNPGSGGPIMEASTPQNKNITGISIISANPASKYVDVQLFLDNNKNAEIGLYDITGKLLKSTSVTPSAETITRITRDNLPSGVYFLVVKTDAERYCRKIIFS